MPDDTPSPATAAALPRWDLSDLYPAPDAPALTADLERLNGETKSFAARYQGKLAGLPAAEFLAACDASERIQEGIGRIGSYAQLFYSANVTDPAAGAFYQTISERLTDIGTPMVFFALEINKIADADLEAILARPEAARHRPWLRDLRLFRDHMLSEEVERILHERTVVGAEAWTRLYDETLADLRFDVNGKALTLTEALDLFSDPDRAVRRQAGTEISRVLTANLRLFAHTTNTLAKMKEIEERTRGYPHPLAYRNLSNQVEDAVVDALVAAVKDSYGRLAHRYYALKARWLGLDRLAYYDRNAPLPEDDDRTYDWNEAVALVLAAYRRFSPELADVADNFFQKPWIDAEVRPGKASGAFAHPTVPSAHPYLLVNFLGKARDVMTLAHELGHGVHQVLAGERGYFGSQTPLTLAETASVFGEMLTFRAMLDAETDPRRRRVLLARKVEDMLNTVVRQIAFHEFELAVHTERRTGELSADRLAEIWLKVQGDSLGPAFDFAEEYRCYWAYIGHFIHAPFYVYAYAFGDCLVNSLYAEYRSGRDGFAGKYLEMLRAGGTLRHKELLAPFGLDATDPGFWRRGIDVVAGLIDELEAVS